jgi:hypothetical protein
LSREDKNQRTAARLLIAVFVLFSLVVLAFPNLSFGQGVAALQSGSPSSSPTGSGSPSASPSGSGTASPLPTGPAIQFLNPSGHSSVVSTKDDGTDTTYHLVAAARAVPTNPVVEFKIKEGTGPETTIGIGTRVGLTDTFHFNWAAGTLADGDYTVIAIMYNGALEVARDEQEVTVNNEDTVIPPPPDPQAESVEIVSPSNGSLAGFFQPIGETVAHTIIDVTSSDDTGFPSLSSGTETVLPFYSKTPPGTEPEWIACGDGSGGEAEGTTAVRCTLEEGDGPASVTALAVVAEPLAPVVSGSGDAHRVFSYTQVPTSIGLAPVNQTGKVPNECSDSVVATMLDQNGRKIAGLNTDVHAKGPSDNLFFDTLNNSANQPPDKAHSGPEPGWDCDAGEEAGEQGQHEFPPGNPDTKHVESLDGSDDEGQFTFQLRSTAAGQTDFAVIADEDDDDEWCVAEVSAEGTITWTATASPSPTPSGSSSPSSSPSGSPSSSASSSASPSGSPPDQGPQELGPEKQVCPRATGSPTPTGTANRSISLTASKSKIKPGAPVVLSGNIDASSAQCADNELVEIRRRIHGTDVFEDFRTTATDDDGDYQLTTRPTRGADYQATAPEAGSCDEAVSAAVPVLVKVKVTIKVVDGRNGPKVTGKVSPNHRRTKVTLQRKKGGGWKKVARDTLNRRSRYLFTDINKSGRYRVVWPQQHEDHVKGVSRGKRVRAT